MEENIRKLARSYEHQLLYNRAKEIGTIRLFDNTFDFSFIQLKYLQWLEVYNSLFADLYMEEDYISEEIIRDDIRTEAYLLYKSKKKKKKESDKQNKKEIDTTGNIPSIIFKRKSKTEVKDNDAN